MFFLQNEPAVGNVLANIFAETNLKREDLFISAFVST